MNRIDEIKGRMSNVCGPWKVDIDYSEDILDRENRDILTSYTPNGSGCRPDKERVDNAVFAANAYADIEYLMSKIPEDKT